MKKNEDYIWVIRGKQRKKVIESLTRPKIPSQIKGDTKLSLNNVSDVLRSFQKKKIARCLNPKEKTGRLYELTPKGMRIREELEKY